MPILSTITINVTVNTVGMRALIDSMLISGAIKAGKPWGTSSMMAIPLLSNRKIHVARVAMITAVRDAGKDLFHFFMHSSYATFCPVIGVNIMAVAYVTT